MIDIHTHILYGIDDGAKTVEDSINLIKEEIQNGITDIVLTSHYVVDTNYNANNKLKREIFESIKEKTTGLNVNLYLGNEVYATNNIMKLINNDEILTINGSKYLLIELPLNGSIRYLSNLLYELNSNKITPILAHPERYISLQNNKARIKTLLEYDIIFQSNLASLNGLYGNKTKKLVKWLLKKDLIQIMATDIHRTNKIKPDKAIKKLTKLVGEEKTKELIEINPRKVINNESIEVNMDKIYNDKYFN